MSRSLSPQALKAIFAQETDDTIISLFTLYEGENPDDNSIRICDGYTRRVVDSGNDLVYGVIKNDSNAVQRTFWFLPVNVTLPDDTDGVAAKASLSIYDVTYHLIPTIRSLNSPPKVYIELMLASYLDPSHANYNINAQPEAIFTGLYISNFTYNANVVQADLSMINYANEPFPAHAFIPKYFPGLF